LLDTPVLDVLSVGDPLLLASDEWLRGWEAWATELTTISGIAVGVKALWDGLGGGGNLSGREVWNSGVGDGDLIVFPIDNVLSIILPLFLSSDEWLWAWISWTAELSTSNITSISIWVQSLWHALNLSS
jgi:hypothetical protein